MNDDNKKLNRSWMMFFIKVGKTKRLLFILLVILVTFTSMNCLSAPAHEIRIPETMKAEKDDENTENKTNDYPAPEEGIQLENTTQGSDTQKDDQQDMEDSEDYKIKYDDDPILGDENRLILEN